MKPTYLFREKMYFFPLSIFSGFICPLALRAFIFALFDDYVTSSTQNISIQRIPRKVRKT